MPPPCPRRCLAVLVAILGCPSAIGCSGSSAGRSEIDAAAPAAAPALESALTWLLARDQVVWLVPEGDETACRRVELHLVADDDGLGGYLERSDGMAARGWVGYQRYELGLSGSDILIAGPDGYGPREEPQPREGSGVVVTIHPPTLLLLRRLEVIESNDTGLALRETPESFDRAGTIPVEWWFADHETCETARASGDSRYIYAGP